jgi:hypothetical protein
MAGSKSWRQYIGDDGTSYSVNVDESNANATIGGAGGNVVLLPVRTTNDPSPPCSLKKRYANTYNATTPNIKRKFYIGTTAAQLAAAAPGAQISASIYPGAGDTAGPLSTWIISSLRGEKSRKPPSITAPDTGLTDGTTSQ